MKPSITEGNRLQICVCVDHYHWHKHTRMPWLSRYTHSSVSANLTNTTKNMSLWLVWKFHSKCIRSKSHTISKQRSITSVNFWYNQEFFYKEIQLDSTLKSVTNTHATTFNSCLTSCFLELLQFRSALHMYSFRIPVTYKLPRWEKKGEKNYCLSTCMQVQTQ